MNETLLTPREAAYILNEPLKAVTKVLDSHGSLIRKIRRGGVSVRVLDEHDLLYFVAIQHIGDKLTPKGRDEFYGALKAVSRTREAPISFGHVQVELHSFLDELKGKLQRYQALKNAVRVPEVGGEPVIAGTDVEVYRIAALLDGGMTIEEVLHDFPSLEREQVLAAQAYTVANPKPGRPYPKLSFKRAAQAMQLDALDEVLGSSGDGT